MHSTHIWFWAVLGSLQSNLWRKTAFLAILLFKMRFCGPVGLLFWYCIISELYNNIEVVNCIALIHCFGQFWDSPEQFLMEIHIFSSFCGSKCGFVVLYAFYFDISLYSNRIIISQLLIVCHSYIVLGSSGHFRENFDEKNTFLAILWFKMWFCGPLGALFLHFYIKTIQ